MDQRVKHEHSFMTAFTIRIIILAELITVLSCGEVNLLRQKVKRHTGLYKGPYFDLATSTNITTQLGAHGYLPCKIKQLDNKSVSWIRRRDSHILTVDRYTFIADERFQAFFIETSNTWTLQIKYVQARDAGLYECQVSTEPKMSHFVQLNVVVPKIQILGEADMYVKAGSTVNLKCVITQSLEDPAYIFWYRDDSRVLNFDRSKVDVRLERVGSDTTVGTLIIYNTKREDSGNYSCSPSNLEVASVMLHVLNGEQPAAMQHGNTASTFESRIFRNRILLWMPIMSTFRHTGVCILANLTLMVIATFLFLIPNKIYRNSDVDFYLQ